MVIIARSNPGLQSLPGTASGTRFQEDFILSFIYSFIHSSISLYTVPFVCSIPDPVSSRYLSIHQPPSPFVFHPSCLLLVPVSPHLRTPLRTPSSSSSFSLSFESHPLSLICFISLFSLAAHRAHPAPSPSPSSPLSSPPLSSAALAPHSLQAPCSPFCLDPAQLIVQHFASNFFFNNIDFFLTPFFHSDFLLCVSSASLTPYLRSFRTVCALITFAHLPGMPSTTQTPSNNTNVNKSHACSFSTHSTNSCGKVQDKNNLFCDTSLVRPPTGERTKALSRALSLSLSYFISVLCPFPLAVSAISVCE